MLLNYSICLKRLDSYVDEYNTSRPSGTHPLRGSMVHTAKEIVRMYGRALLQASKVVPIIKGNLPSLRANNIQLSKITKLSPRTIRRHIRKLLEAKIITRKVGHGTRSSYELWISPEILCIKGLTTPKSSQLERISSKNQSTENQIIKKSKTTKCPHRDIEKKNNILIAVDKFQKQGITALAKALSSNRQDKRCSLPRTDFLDITGYTQLKDPVTQLKEAGGTKAKDASDDLAFCKPGGAKNVLNDSQTSPSRHTFLLKYAKKLWELAREKLYCDTYLTQSQHSSAITLLYKWYSSVSDEKLENTHSVYCKRIEMVRQHIARDPENRYVQLPYRYFDPDNPSGFTGTKSWYEKQKERRNSLKPELILHTQIQKFKRNERKDTAEGQPRLTVYRECWQRVSALEDATLLNRFEKEAQHCIQF